MDHTRPADDRTSCFLFCQKHVSYYRSKYLLFTDVYILKAPVFVIIRFPINRSQACKNSLMKNLSVHHNYSGDVSGISRMVYPTHLFLSFFLCLSPCVCVCVCVCHAFSLPRMLAGQFLKLSIYLSCLFSSLMLKLSICRSCMVRILINCHRRLLFSVIHSNKKQHPSLTQRHRFCYKVKMSQN